MKVHSMAMFAIDCDVITVPLFLLSFSLQNRD